MTILYIKQSLCILRLSLSSVHEASLKRQTLFVPFIAGLPTSFYLNQSNHPTQRQHILEMNAPGIYIARQVNILNHISDVFAEGKQERTHEVLINEIPVSSTGILI